MILKSDKNTCVQLVSNEQPHIEAQGSVDCIQYSKYMSWIYCNNNLRIVMLIDPPPVEEKSVYAIEALGAQHFFIILTGCHRRKKENLITWTSLFPFTILTPQSTMKELLVSCERIIDNDTVHTISYTRNGNTFFIGYIIGSVLHWYRAILLYIPPYLFSGHIMQPHNTHNYVKSQTMQNFIRRLPKNTIVLPELGGIHTLHA